MLLLTPKENLCHPYYFQFTFGSHLTLLENDTKRKRGKHAFFHPKFRRHQPVVLVFLCLYLRGTGGGGGSHPNVGMLMSPRIWLLAVSLRAERGVYIQPSGGGGRQGGGGAHERDCSLLPEEENERTLSSQVVQNAEGKPQSALG